MRFWKMEGLGNDFVVVEGPIDMDAGTIRLLCDRRRGVGADGVLAVTPLGPSTVRMEYWNADGTLAEMCGNGLRCVARYARLREWVAADRFTVETPVGPRSAVLTDTGALVEVGPVTVGERRLVDGHSVVPASVGNPHAVLVVDSVESAPVAEVGPRLETAPDFPDRTNVEFLEIVDDHRIRLRVWERGVGETLACGSGAVAAAAVVSSQHRRDTEIEVHLPGGVATVRLVDGIGWLEGPARLVFEGEWPYSRRNTETTLPSTSTP